MFNPSLMESDHYLFLTIDGYDLGTCSTQCIVRLQYPPSSNATYIRLHHSSRCCSLSPEQRAARGKGDSRNHQKRGRAESAHRHSLFSQQSHFRRNWQPGNPNPGRCWGTIFPLTNTISVGTDAVWGVSLTVHSWAIDRRSISGTAMPNNDAFSGYWLF